MKSRIAADRLRDLQTITDAALAFLPLDVLLDELLTRVVGILGADTAAILLLDEDENELVARAAKGLEEEVERGVRIPLGRGFAGRIAAQRDRSTGAPKPHRRTLVGREHGLPCRERRRRHGEVLGG